MMSVASAIYEAEKLPSAGVAGIESVKVHQDEVNRLGACRRDESIKKSNVLNAI
jgi:hypothetical protein